jgi:hypothetical protein
MAKGNRKEKVRAPGDGGEGDDDISEGMEGLSVSVLREGDEFDDVSRMRKRIERVIERECGVSGGMETSAKSWVERAKKLQSGKGRGKVNLGYKPS